MTIKGSVDLVSIALLYIILVYSKMECEQPNVLEIKTATNAHGECH